MKIILINKFLFPKGGDAISAITTGKLLSSKGHNVVLWGMDHELNPEYPYKDLFVRRVDLNSSKDFKERIRISLNILYSIEAKKKLAMLLEREKPDIVHLGNFAHQISPSILHVLKQRGIPSIMTMRDYKLICASYAMLAKGKVCEACRGGHYYQCFLKSCVKESRAKSFLNTIEMYLHHKILHIYDLIDIFISPSQFFKTKVEDMGFKGKVVHLLNFVNIEEYQPRYDWDQTENSIVYVGRLSREKGLFTMIKAMKGLPEVTLKVIGEGPLGDELRRRSQVSGVTNVKFIGYMSGEELKEEIRKSMFVVLPSEWYENNPRSIIEGFALGKPAVGARIGGIPELARYNETGLTFEPWNVQDLKAKIEYMVSHPDEIRRMGMNARRFVEMKLNAQWHYEQLMDFYQEAINRHR